MVWIEQWPYFSYIFPINAFCCKDLWIFNFPYRIGPASVRELTATACAPVDESIFYSSCSCKLVVVILQQFSDLSSWGTASLFERKFCVNDVPVSFVRFSVFRAPICFRTTFPYRWHGRCPFCVSSTGKRKAVIRWVTLLLKCHFTA